MRLRQLAYVDDEIDYGRHEAYVCGDCLESFFTPESSDAIDRKAIELGTWGSERPSTVTASGRSLVVRVPSDIARELKLEKGQRVFVRPRGRRRFEVELA